MIEAPYDLTLPTQRSTSVIFASPHSGRSYSPEFLRAAVLDEREIRSSEDAFVDDLFAAAPSCGAPLIAARAPRAFVDLNRAPEELDAALIQGVRRAAHNPRIASGLGVVPRVVANGREIYRGKLSLSDVHDRINRVWHPYHDLLQTLIDESHAQFEEAILIDCHSMPREALDTMSPAGAHRPDVVLGDRFGAAAATSVISQVEAAFTARGLRVARNSPFAGAYITQHYGRPSWRQHAVQIEIDRSLYMHEGEIRKSRDYESFRTLMAEVIADIAEIGRSVATKIAAE